MGQLARSAFKLLSSFDKAQHTLVTLHLAADILKSEPELRNRHVAGV